MGTIAPHEFLVSYSIDEVLETVNFPSDKRSRVESYLMRLAPDAYGDTQIPLERIWWALPNDVQETINAAIIREYKEA